MGTDPHPRRRRTHGVQVVDERLIFMCVKVANRVGFPRSHADAPHPSPRPQTHTTHMQNKRVTKRQIVPRTFGASVGNIDNIVCFCKRALPDHRPTAFFSPLRSTGHHLPGGPHPRDPLRRGGLPGRQQLSAAVPAVRPPPRRQGQSGPS